MYSYSVLQKHSVWFLKKVFESCKPLSTHRPIHHSVVTAQRHSQHISTTEPGCRDNLECVLTKSVR